MRHGFVLIAVGLGLWGPAASAAGRFPPSIYPKPAKFPNWGLGTGCASLSGVQVPGSGATSGAFATLARFGRVSRQTDFRLSDRALWPVVRQSWRHGPPMGRGLLRRSNIAGAGRGTRSPYAELVRHNCGAAILARSIWFTVCGRPCYPALTGHFLLIDRRGHWLVWFQYP